MSDEKPVSIPFKLSSGDPVTLRFEADGKSYEMYLSATVFRILDAGPEGAPDKRFIVDLHWQSKAVVVE